MSATNSHRRAESRVIGAAMRWFKLEESSIYGNTPSSWAALEKLEAACEALLKTRKRK